MQDEEPLINLTPLIDVVFVILIAFILVAPLVQAEKIDLARGPRTEALQKKSPIIISVLPDNQIILNKKSLALHDLKKELLIEKNRHPDAEPILFHDKSATFGLYQDIKQTAEDAGFKNLHVILEGK